MSTQPTAGTPDEYAVLLWVPVMRTQPTVGTPDEYEYAVLLWTHLMSRHDKRLNFYTSVFLEDPKLTRKQRDSRQKFHGDKPKNQSGFILLEHKYINLYLVTPFGTKMQS